MSEPTCEVCNWTNTSCLNLGEFGKPKWVCHGCIQRIVNERDELANWKKEAMQVMPDFQAIGKALNLPLGVSISPEILPGILKLKADVERLRSAIRRAGFAVMETSSDWSIHDISELAKNDEKRTAEIIIRNLELEAEVKQAKQSGMETHYILAVFAELISAMGPDSDDASAFMARYEDMVQNMYMAIQVQKALAHSPAKP